MGTHPIFESDFDCLTEIGLKPKKMATPTGKSRIDSMGHDELQAFAKKQMTMLKNLKNKADSKSKEADTLLQEKESLLAKLAKFRENEEEREKDHNDKNDEL